MIEGSSPGRSPDGLALQMPPPASIPMPAFPMIEGSSPGRSPDGLALQMPPCESIPMPAFQTPEWSSPRQMPGGEMSMSSRPSVDVAPPRSFISGIPSVGALLHAQGRCLPCRFHKQTGLCQKGAKCIYCHHHAHDEWSQSKTMKYFRAHIWEYRAYYGPWLESISREQDMS
eukprot:TRINITY_DN6353_c0_g1_i2.p1 TRINITY_DN6353_c0_g1~~TRINITY_DN6353_c0_g1_i2.p1  ORF type:complete len:198 (+),score=17.48 TRINITY_DN6353_c0_g1_i2:79-594(+)